MLGASIAGLLAARALSETFDRVTVIDRDRLTVGGPRKGVPQGLHAHFLLARGREVLEEFFPGLTDKLAAAGGTRMDLHDDVAWFNGPQPIIGGPSDLLALGLGRPALEDHVRGRVAQLSNVDLLGGYEAVRPDGYLAVGHALCAFNPLYAQGMTVAALEALVLRDCLRASRTGLPRRFYAAAAKVIDIPWDMAVGGDLAYPWVEGQRTMKVRILNAYLAKLLRAAETEETVSLAFHRAINLTNGPEKLFAPGVLRRVLFPRRPPGPAPVESPATTAGSVR